MNGLKSAIAGVFAWQPMARFLPPDNLLKKLPGSLGPSE